MKIREDRLSKLLEPLGFVFTGRSPAGGWLFYVRDGCVEDVYEGVEIAWVGRRGEAVAAYAIASTIRRSRHRWKGLVEDSLIWEVAADQERGWTVVESSHEAMIWEKAVAAACDSAARDVASKKGPYLVEHTREARQAVQEYERCMLDRALTIEQLEGLASQDDCLRASELVNGRSLIWVPEDLPKYYLASLAILHFAPHIEGRPLGWGPGNLLDDVPFMWRLHILVDRLERFGT